MRAHVSELPEAERKLFERAFVIKENFNRIPDYVPSVESRKVIETATRRIGSRVFDLFTTYMKGLLCKEDKIAEWMFTVRFWWFMHDISIMLSYLA